MDQIPLTACLSGRGRASRLCCNLLKVPSSAILKCRTQSLRSLPEVFKDDGDEALPRESVVVELWLCICAAGGGESSGTRIMGCVGGRWARISSRVGTSNAAEDGLSLSVAWMERS